MTQLRMDENQDVLIRNNRLEFTVNNSDEEISQRILQRLRFYLAEWFLDNTEGIPYFQLVFTKGVDSEIIDSLFKTTIIQTEGVSSLTRFAPLDIDLNTRVLSVDFDVRTINGNNLTISENV